MALSWVNVIWYQLLDGGDGGGAGGAGGDGGDGGSPGGDGGDGAGDGGGDNGGGKGFDMVRVSRSIYRMRAAFLAQLFWPSSFGPAPMAKKGQRSRPRRGSLHGTSPRPARLEGSPVALLVATGPGSSGEPSRPDAQRFFSTAHLSHPCFRCNREGP